MTVEGPLGSLAVVQAVESKGTLLKVNLRGLTDERPDGLLWIGLGNV